MEEECHRTANVEVDVIQAVDLPALDRDGMLYSYLHCMTTRIYNIIIIFGKIKTYTVYSCILVY